MAEDRLIDRLSPETRSRYEAFAESMRGAASPAWANMAMSIRAAGKNTLAWTLKPCFLPLLRNGKPPKKWAGMKPLQRN